MYLTDETILAKYVIKTHYIMKVVAVHPEDQTVDVVEDVYRYTNSPVPFTTVINELGNPVDVGLSKKMKLLNIPVKQERWGQFAIQCNPAVGDTGYIEIMTNDIRDWMLNGSDSVPWSDDHFDERSCVFVPFVQNATNKQEDYPADNTQLVIKSDHLSITMTDQPDPEQGSQDDPVRNISIVGDVVVTGKVDITGDVNITGKLTASSDIESTGGKVKAKENVESTDGDIKAGNVGLKTHTHTIPAGGIVTAGSATTQATQSDTNVPAPDNT